MTLFARPWMYVIPLLAVGAIAGGLLLVTGDLEPPKSADDESQKLVLLCDQTLEAVTAGVELEHGGGLLGLFARRHTTPIDARYAPATELRRQIEQTNKADLLLTADELLVEWAIDAGLIAEAHKIAEMVPVLLVHRERGASINDITDLRDSAFRLAVTDPESSAIGRITHGILEHYEITTQTLEHDSRHMAEPTAMDLARRVQSGNADATIVWKPVAHQFPHNTRVIDIPLAPEIRAGTSAVHVAVLAGSDRPDEGQRFASFMKGAAAREMLSRHHYTIESDSAN